MNELDLAPASHTSSLLYSPHILQARKKNLLKIKSRTADPFCVLMSVGGEEMGEAGGHIRFRGLIDMGMKGSRELPGGAGGRPVRPAATSSLE